MFSWWSGAHADQRSSRSGSTTRGTRSTTKVRQQHIEVIGGGHTPPSPVLANTSGPVLPVEILSLCAAFAAEDIVRSDEISRDDQSLSNGAKRELLQLCTVCHSWYTIVLPHLLHSITLTAAEQSRALERDLYALNQVTRSLRLLAARHIRRFCAMQRRSENAATLTQSRPSLYDFLTGMNIFENSCKNSLHCTLPWLESLEELHLEMSPEILRHGAPKVSPRLPRKTDMTGPKRSIRSLSFMLSTFGGTGCEDVFVGLTKPAVAGTPWSSLTHLQISGPAGFRVSMSTASAIGSLPSLTNLSLVMPNFVRDVGQRGDIGNPPAAFEFLILLLADQLKELNLIGHAMGGYLGHGSAYGMWLTFLQLPYAAKERREEKGLQSPLLARLITVQSEGQENVHPNRFASWMVARAADGSHFDWPTRSGEQRDGSEQGGRIDSIGIQNLIDRQMDIRWTAQEWQVPYERETQRESDTPGVQDADDNDDEETVQALAPRSGPSFTGLASDQQFLGIDDLD